MQFIQRSGGVETSPLGQYLCLLLVTTRAAAATGRKITVLISMIMSGYFGRQFGDIYGVWKPHHVGGCNRHLSGRELVTIDRWNKMTMNKMDNGRNTAE